MTFIRTAAIAALALIASALAADAREWKKIRIGTEGAYPPFNFFDSNRQLQGFDIEIAKALCTAAKVECEFVAQDWDGIIPALLADKYDAIIASMSITEERRRTVAFTNKYYQTPAAFITAKTSGLTGTSPENLRGKTIGAQSSTTHATYLEDIYQKVGVTVKLYATQDEANLDLAAGRLDAVLADKVVLADWLQKTEGACCTFLGAEIRDVKYFGEGAGIAIRKEDEDLRLLLNKAIEQIRTDGTYERINAQFFPFNVY